MYWNRWHKLWQVKAKGSGGGGTIETDWITFVNSKILLMVMDIIQLKLFKWDYFLIKIKFALLSIELKMWVKSRVVSAVVGWEYSNEIYVYG